MSEQDRPWYTITRSTSSQPLKHTFTEQELTKAVRMYAYLRRDLAPDYRIDLRWIGDPLGSREMAYEGRIWKEDRLIVQERAWSVRLLLSELRAASAALELPVQW